VSLCGCVAEQAFAVGCLCDGAGRVRCRLSYGVGRLGSCLGARVVDCIFGIAGRVLGFLCCVVCRIFRFISCVVCRIFSVIGCVFGLVLGIVRCVLCFVLGIVGRILGVVGRVLGLVFDAIGDVAGVVARGFGRELQFVALGQRFVVGRLLAVTAGDFFCPFRAVGFGTLVGLFVRGLVASHYGVCGFVRRVLCLGGRCIRDGPGSVVAVRGVVCLLLVVGLSGLVCDTVIRVVEIIGILARLRHFFDCFSR
jgi:hypothetical protein